MPEDLTAPTPPPRTAVERVIASVVAPGVAPLLRETWRGLQHVPGHGACVVAGNHLSYADPFVLGRFLLVGAHRMPRFLGKAEVFETPVLGGLLRRAGQIPVYRGTARAADSFSAARAALDRGELVTLLPEGTLTRDPELWPMTGKTGAARLAMTAGAPLVPVAMWGPERIIPPRRPDARAVLGALRLHQPVTVVAGPPVHLEDLRGQELSTSVLVEATRRLMADITALLAEIRGERPEGAPMDNPRVVFRTRGEPLNRSRREGHSS